MSGLPGFVVALICWAALLLSITGALTLLLSITDALTNNYLTKVKACSSNIIED